MLLGIWGPFACGKTTFLNAFMESRDGDKAFKDVVFVFADLSLEYHMNRFGRFTDRKLISNDNHWTGVQKDKIEHINEMIADDSKIWVVESARYFSGMYECLVEAHNLCDGGLRFIIPVCDGPTMIKFLKARCKSKGKEFRADYWVPDRAAYEADARYTNAAKNWFEPNGIAYDIVQIDESRSSFSKVGGILNAWLRLQPDQWYGISHTLKVFANVPEAIELERQRHGRY